MTGAGQGDNGSPGFLCHNLTHAQQRARLHTLGDGDEGRAFLQIGRDLAADTADGGGGGGDDHQRTTGHAGRIGGDGNASGKKYAGKPGIAPGLGGLRCLFRIMKPEGDIVAVSVQAKSQRGAPRAAAYNRCFHFCFPFPNRFVFRSSPLMSRTILPRCINRHSAPMKIPPSMTSGLS